MKNVAQVTDGTENVKLAAWMNQTPAVIVNIQRQPGANIIQVVDSIKALLPKLRNTLPSSIKVAVLTDRTTTVRASVSDVQFELMVTIALVIMVIFLFLRTLAATIIPSVAVPLSIVGTFAAMYMLGYSLNNLTLMALTISTGFVVDDAIVMIENIARYVEQGMQPLEAALTGRGRNWLHNRVVNDFADRGADPAALHGRYRGAAVSRVCRHAGGHHPGVGCGVADAHADAVAQRCCATNQRRSKGGSIARRRRSSRIPSPFMEERSRMC